MTFEEFKLSLLLLGFTPTSTANKYRWDKKGEYVFINQEDEMGIAHIATITEQMHLNYSSIIDALGKANDS